MNCQSTVNFTVNAKLLSDKELCVILAPTVKILKIDSWWRGGERSSRGTRLMACLKMAGDPPAAQVSKVASAREFKDNNDHKDIKDAREGI